MGIIMKNGRTYRANTTAVYQWIYAYSCLAGGCCHLYFSFLSFFPPGFFPWDSYQFVLILPHPGVVVWKLRCRQGKKMCVSEREEERERKDWRERKGKENQCRRWQVWGGRQSGFLSVSKEECLTRNKMPTKWGRIRGPSVSRPEPPLLSTEDGWDCSSWEREGKTHNGINTHSILHSHAKASRTQSYKQMLSMHKYTTYKHRGGKK